MSYLEHYLRELRNQRNYKLVESDKYMLPDYPISPEDLEKIKIYRKELRDFFQREEIINYNNLSIQLPEFPINKISGFNPKLPELPIN